MTQRSRIYNDIELSDNVASGLSVTEGLENSMFIKQKEKQLQLQRKHVSTCKIVE